MDIFLSKKFSEKQIDTFIAQIHDNFLKKPNDSYNFDLTNTEWISNQGLLIFSGILKYFIEKNIEFKVKFFTEGKPLKEIPKRVAIQIIQIWEIWGLWKIFEIDQCQKYLGITYSTIKGLKDIYLDHDFHRTQIYEMHEITPFVILEKISNYDDKSISNILKPYHSLNEATTEIVNIYNCEHPFLSGVFGEIISKEIYENFLDHFKNSFFFSKNEYAFMSVAIKGNIKEENPSYDIQSTLKYSFESEELSESIDFFYDHILKQYKNKSYITYSFLDFGDGICNTLRSSYLRKNNSNGDDFEILKYAFTHDGSRHQIKNPFYSDSFEEFIPRGLFDVICLVQRYRGLLIVRSNYGKVIYDFSNTDSINEAVKQIGGNKSYFPGTFITIYLPAISINKKLDYSTFKPEYKSPDFTKSNLKILSIYELIISSGLKKKRHRYNALFNEFNKLVSKERKSLNLISLKNINDLQLVKKILFYLVSSYNVNSNNSFLIFYPPSLDLLDEFNYEIANLSYLDRNYKIHPLPIIYKNSDNNLNIYWLGIFDEKDKQKLDNLLFDVFSLAESDFNFPDYILGHFNKFDKHGNLTSSFPKLNEINEFLSFFEIKDIVSSNKYISKEEGYVYLCNGNYYQNEFYELTKLLNDKNLCRLVSKLLFENAENVISRKNDFPRHQKYIAITSSSHLIVDSLLDEGVIRSTDDIIYLDNYHLDNLELKLPHNTEAYDYILLCDVLSTGMMANKLQNSLMEYGATLKCISVIVNAVDLNNKTIIKYYKNIQDIVVSIHNHPIIKHERINPNTNNPNPIIERSLKESNIIRINPYTNIPITFSINETNPEHIILSSKEFIQEIKEDHIRTGPLIFNNLLHPYFFITSEIIKEAGISLLSKIFNKEKIIKEEKCCLLDRINTENLSVFYPKNSDIEYLDKKQFSQTVLKNERSINYYKLERFSTEVGWKFPHTTDYFNKIVKNNQVLILDDGSCTGASLMQMINEIAFFSPQKITLLCLIGRVSEHKREFLTSISQIIKGSTIIEVEIFFGSFWHIPTYYLEDNPNIKERNWLQDILKISNLPTEIYNIASEIIELLEPKYPNYFSDYKFFPKINNSIPKKELISIRNEVGRINGYRFYKESFTFFNELIKLYSFKSEQNDRYQTIELLCGVIAYEPFVYAKIKSIMPDIAEKLVEFVDVLLFKSPRTLSTSPLTYKWNIRDLFHLFFIINDEKTIYKKLLDHNNSISLIKVIELNDKKSVNYLLYKILRYFPLKKSDIRQNFDRKILVLLDKYKKNEDFSSESRRMIKVFLSFTHTLPKKESFENQVALLHKNFETIADEKTHLSNVVANLGFMLTDITTRLKNYDDLALKKFRSSWDIIAEFIEPILSFHQSYPSFFPSKISTQVEELRKIFKNLNQRIIIRINDINISKIQFDLKLLQSNYFNCNSNLFDLFIETTTSDVYTIISTKIYEFQNTEVGKKRKIQFKSKLDRSCIIDFPSYYFSNIILEILFNNFRHSCENEEVTILIKDDSSLGIFSMEIFNKISDDVDSGGGNGITKLKDAKKYPNNIFDYQYKTLGKNIFYQVVRIKII